MEDPGSTADHIRVSGSGCMMRCWTTTGCSRELQHQEPTPPRRDLRIPTRDFQTPGHVRHGQNSIHPKGPSANINLIRTLAGCVI